MDVTVGEENCNSDKGSSTYSVNTKTGAEWQD